MPTHVVGVGVGGVQVVHVARRWKGVLCPKRWMRRCWIVSLRMRVLRRLLRLIRCRYRRERGGADVAGRCAV